MPKLDRWAALLENLFHGELIASKTRDKSVILFFKKIIQTTLTSIWIITNGTQQAPFVWSLTIPLFYK